MRPARLFVGLIVLAGCGRAAPPVDPHAARAEEILAGLRLPIVVKGTTPATYTLAERMARHQTPGISIAIADSGRIVWARGFGLAEAGTADSVTDSTLFQAASISKPVAATVMLRLVEEGKLALDEPVNGYLRSWKVPDNRHTAKEAVTLRRLVSHSAGLTVHGFPGYKQGDSVPTVPQILDGAKPANTAPVRVDTTPGAIWRYSGGGTTVMQLTVSDVTGEPFAAVAKRLVLDPIGMSHSSYEQPLAAALRGREAAGHKQDGTVIPGRWHTYPEQAAAGLWTTPTDLLKWAIEIAAARAGKSTKVLSQAMATQMLTVQKAPMGLGPSLEGSGRAFNFSHGGANEGFRGHVIYFPETGQGAAVMTNSDRGDALLGEVLQGIAAVYHWVEFEPREVAVIAVDSAGQAPYVASYSSKVPFPVTITISRGPNGLVIEAPGVIPRQDLAFTATHKVIALESGLEAEFGTDATGAVDRITLYGITLRRDK